MDKLLGRGRVTGEVEAHVCTVQDAKKAGAASHH